METIRMPEKNHPIFQMITDHKLSEVSVFLEEQLAKNVDLNTIKTELLILGHYKNPYELNMLEFAILEGDEALTRLLIQHISPGLNGSTAIEMAALKGHINLLHLLLQDNRCPYDAIEYEALILAIGAHKNEAAYLLLAQEENRVLKLTYYGRALKIASTVGNLEICSHLQGLYRSDSNLHLSNSTLHDAISAAFLANHQDVVIMLYEWIDGDIKKPKGLFLTQKQIEDIHNLVHNKAIVNAFKSSSSTSTFPTEIVSIVSDYLGVKTIPKLKTSPH